MTIAALRKIQDEADAPIEAPKPAHPAPTAWPTATVPAPAAKEEPKPLPVGKLLAWGEAHADADVRDQATRIRMSLAGLRRRYDVDQELGLLTLEEEQLRTRLAEIEARTAELAPAKKAKSTRRPVDYPAAEVRAWAAANGHQVSPVGRIPKPVVDAWRTATDQPTA